MALHEHCTKCFSKDCTKDSSFIGFGDDSCPMVECGNECGAKLHECKLQDHMEKICPNSVTHCVNHVYGCPHKMARKKIQTHLSICPASVVICQHDLPEETSIPLEKADEPEDTTAANVGPPFCITHTQNHIFSEKCYQKLRRDEYYYHYKNVHGDLQCEFDSWYNRRCPLHVYGCQKAAPRLIPVENVKLVYNPEVKCYATVSKDAPCLQPPGSSDTTGLSSLPLDLCMVLFDYLDSQSLMNLSLVSKKMRGICHSVLKNRGIVTLKWTQEKVNGITQWKSKFLSWSFTTAFSPIKSWKFAEPKFNVTEHMLSCPYFVSQVNQRPEEKIQVMIFPAQQE